MTVSLALDLKIRSCNASKKPCQDMALFAPGNGRGSPSGTLSHRLTPKQEAQIKSSIRFEETFGPMTNSH